MELKKWKFVVQFLWENWEYGTRSPGTMACSEAQRLQSFMASQPTPPNVPPPEIRPY